MIELTKVQLQASLTKLLEQENGLHPNTLPYVVA